VSKDDIPSTWANFHNSNKTTNPRSASAISNIWNDPQNVPNIPNKAGILRTLNQARLQKPWYSLKYQTLK
jgi:hypothetical protein